MYTHINSPHCSPISAAIHSHPIHDSYAQLHQAVHTLQHSQPHEVFHRMKPCKAASNDPILQPHTATYKSSHTLQTHTATTSHLYTAGMHSHIKSPIHCSPEQPHHVTNTLQPYRVTHTPGLCTTTSNHPYTGAMHSHMKWLHTLQTKTVTSTYPYTAPMQSHAMSPIHCSHAESPIHWIHVQPHEFTHCSHACSHIK